MTQEQYEDFLGAIAENEAEYDAQETEYNATYAALVTFCNENPGHPDCADEATNRSGPSTPWHLCDLAAGGALVALGNFAGRLWTSSALATGGRVGLTVAAVGSSTILLYAGAGAAALALGGYVYCKYSYLPQLDSAVLSNRPEFFY